MAFKIVKQITECDRFAEYHKLLKKSKEREFECFLRILAELPENAVQAILDCISFIQERNPWGICKLTIDDSGNFHVEFHRFKNYIEPAGQEDIVQEIMSWLPASGSGSITFSKDHKGRVVSHEICTFKHYGELW